MEPTDFGHKFDGGKKHLPLRISAQSLRCTTSTTKHFLPEQMVKYESGVIAYTPQTTNMTPYASSPSHTQITSSMCNVRIHRNHITAV